MLFKEMTKNVKLFHIFNNLLLLYSKIGQACFTSTNTQKVETQPIQPISDFILIRYFSILPNQFMNYEKISIHTMFIICEIENL